MTGIILVLSSSVIVLAIVLIAIEEGRRRGRAEVASEYAEDAAKARKRMDEALSRDVGRRMGLVRFLRSRENPEVDDK